MASVETRADLARTPTPDPTLNSKVLQGSGHGVAVDWWCFGTLIFEMLVGTPPFYSYNLQTMYRAILHAPLRFPKSMGKAARALLVGLLCRQRAHVAEC